MRRAGTLIPITIWTTLTRSVARDLQKGYGDRKFTHL